MSCWSEIALSWQPLFAKTHPIEETGTIQLWFSGPKMASQLDELTAV